MQIRLYANRVQPIPWLEGEGGERTVVEARKQLTVIKNIVQCSVVDRHRLDADSDPDPRVLN